MKIGFVSDLHLGASQSLGKIDPDTQINTRLLDFVNTFNSVIDEFEARGVKLVVIPGDITDIKNPPALIVNMLSKCLTRTVQKGLRVFLLAGNHDQTKAIGSTSIDFFNSLGLENIRSFTNFEVYTTQDESGQDINIVFMPYRSKSSYSVYLIEQAIEMIRQDVQRLTVNLKGKKIAVCHYMLGKTVTGQTSETFSLDELVLPLNIFDGFDATIGGHIHKAEILQKEPPIMYVGSLDKLNFGEANHTKVSVVYDTITGQYEIIPNKCRELFEMNFDYSVGEKEYKASINDQIIADIEEYAKEHKLEESIVKLVIKVKENDSYHVNSEKIKEYILNKKVANMVPIQISTASARVLRNDNITENTNSKKAIDMFIENLSAETKNMKVKLKKIANEIIEEIDGK